MTTINQYPTVDELTSSDLMLVWTSANGDTRKVSVATLAAFVQELLTEANGGFETQYSAPSASGFSVTINPTTDGGSVHLLLTPVAGYAAGTIVMPADPVDQQELLVNTTQSVTALTVSGNGSTVTGAPTTLAANAFFRMRYDSVFNGWYRVG